MTVQLKKVKPNGVLCNRRVPPVVKGKVYKLVVRRAMIYSMETVALTKRLEKKLDMVKMRMLRFSSGLTRLDNIKNEEIRRRWKVHELSARSAQ